MWLVLSGVVSLLVFVSSIYGQSVNMKVEPNSFLPSVTPSVTITCFVTSSSESEALPTVLVMQMKRTAFKDSTQKTTKTSPKGRKGTSPHKTSKTTDGPETLVAMVTPGSTGTLHVADAENRLNVKAGISRAESTLTIEISGPQATDAGRYVCHVSALDSNFLIQDLTAVANLTVIGKEESSSLLLAKEQILETQQKHLEEEELALHEELKQALSDNDHLSQRVRSLEVKNDNLTALLQNLTDMISLGKTTSVSLSADDRASLARKFEENLAGTQDELKETQATVDHLEKAVIADMASKLKLLETETLVDMNTRLEKIESKSAATKNVAESSNASPETLADIAKFDEMLNELASRLDQLEQGKVDEISKQVNRLQQNEIPAISDRLDHLERGTVNNSLRGMITTLQQDEADTDEELEKLKQAISQMEARITALEKGTARRNAPGQSDESGTGSPKKSTTLHLEKAEKEEEPNSNEDSAQPASNTSCYVCGDLSKSKPCSVDDLRAAELRRCPVDADFCLNDIFQEENSRKIYKRCVGEAECRRLHNADVREECVGFSFMSRGTFDCHFCCTSNACNFDFKPTVDLLGS